MAWTILGVVIASFIGMVAISRSDTNAIRSDLGHRIDALNSTMRTEIGRLATEIGALGTDLHTEMGQMRTDFGGRIDRLDTKVDHLDERVEEHLRTHAGT